REERPRHGARHGPGAGAGQAHYRGRPRGTHRSHERAGRRQHVPRAVAVPGSAQWVNYLRETRMPRHILLCDDESHILRAAEFKFKRAGYDVTCASDGEEGWERIVESRPDIVVTDCQMPRLSGLGLAERIRTTPATSDLP